MNKRDPRSVCLGLKMASSSRLRRSGLHASLVPAWAMSLRDGTDIFDVQSVTFGQTGASAHV